MDHELDTQNFEQFDEEGPEGGSSSGSGRKWLNKAADPSFIGYTYKNFEAVQPPAGAAEGEVMLKKKGSSRPPLSQAFAGVGLNDK